MSSKNKKDLTRIEDLGEFQHEEDDGESFEPKSEEIPDLPTDSEESPFETSFESSSDDAFPVSEEGETDFSTSSAEDDPFSFPQEDSPADGPQSFDTDSLKFGTESSPAVEEPTLKTKEPATDIVENLFSAEEEKKSEDLFPSIADEAPTPVYEAPKSTQPQEPYKNPENFEDLKKFAENTSFTGMGAEGNPSFSVLIKNVRYIEDVNDIMTLLKELTLLSDTEEQMKNRLMRGHLLVPRISEFAAILLAHKLRRFDIDIQVGLSDEIHPPRDLEKPELGLVSKFNLHQNQSHHFQFQDEKLDISQIIVAATPGLEGYQVLKYVGVASEHAMIDGKLLDDEDSKDIPRHYHELAQKLKAHALKAHANAVVGLNYQLTPVPSEYGINNSKYRLSCTGNLVWVSKA